MSESKAFTARDLKIDIIKGLFVAGMVWSHVCGYTGVRKNPYVDGIWNILALVTFSGFIFCMGFIMQTTFLERGNPPTAKLLRSTLRTMIGYYIAAIGYFIIVRGEFDWPLVWSVLLLQRFGSISEFLLAFALIPLVTIILTRPIQRILSSDLTFFIVVFLLLMTTFIPNQNVRSPYLALFIGSSQGIYYPVLQYYVFFLLGAYYASRKIEVGSLHLLAGFVCLAIFVGAIVNDNIFSRFPPSFAWIVLGWWGFFPWYWISERLSRWRPATGILAPIGANSLFFLVASDLLIFGTSKTFNGAIGVIGATLLALTILAAIFALMRFVRPVKL